jgi:hypothetical protein
MVLRAWILLLYFEFVMRVRRFERLHAIVRNKATQPRPLDERPPVEDLCRAVDLACVFYVKHVLCLQRSAATTLLLRRFGWSAEMLIGVQMIPFKSHAWVEIDGATVSDKPYMREIYQVLECC